MASLPSTLSLSCLSPFSQTIKRRTHIRSPSIKAINSPEPSKEMTTNTKTEEPISASDAQTSSTAPKTPKKPVYSMKKGQIVRVDKEKYLNSINVSPFTPHLGEDHPRS